MKEEVVQGGGEHGALWNSAVDHPSTGVAGEVLAVGGSATDEGGEPAHDVGVEGAVVEFAEKGCVMDAVKCFTVVDGYGCSAERGLLLVESLGYSCREGEECRCSGV